MTQSESAAPKLPNFEIDEVLELKGLFFKIVLIDGFTGKIAIKNITKEEADRLRAE